MLAWLAFLAGLLTTLAPFVARVYLLMPVAGSQQHDHLRQAMLLDRIFPWIVGLGVVIVLLSMVRILRGASTRGGKRLRAAIVVVLVFGATFGALRLQAMGAEQMFREPSTIAFATGTSEALPEDTLVMALRVGGEAKAYPLRLLAYHHQVDDTIGGVPVWVTYCTMCRTGKVFAAERDGARLDFELLGAIRYNSIYRDRQTGTWWRQADGRAIGGPMEGERLRELPSDQLTLGQWLAEHPDTQVFQPDPDAGAGYRMFGFDGWDSQREREDPSPGWRWVVGVEGVDGDGTDAMARAYPWAAVSGLGLVQDELGDLPLAIRTLDDGFSHRVWDRRLDDRVLDFTADEAGAMIDQESGTRFDFAGHGTGGTFDGRQLTQVSSSLEFEHSFVGFHGADLWQAPEIPESTSEGDDPAAESTVNPPMIPPMIPPKSPRWHPPRIGDRLGAMNALHTLTSPRTGASDRPVRGAARGARHLSTRWSLLTILLVAGLSLLFPALAIAQGPIPAPDDVAAPPEDATHTESGLATKVIEAGTGTTHPGPKDSVTAHYTGWTTDGKMFDSSVARGKPATFPLDRVIPGWREGVQLMVEGETRRFWIPQDLAYGGRPGAPAGMLVFDVQLLSFEAPPEPPPAPADVAAPPEDAKVENSGLASKVLQAGTGEKTPGPRSTVTVHYTGWTTDGEMFDSSVMRDQPATFRLDQVIRGWTQGVGMMVEGEKRRLWIPEDLAYGGRPGAPAGMLVFDVELIKIVQQ